jgi:hypothetical protein
MKKTMIQILRERDRVWQNEADANGSRKKLSQYDSQPVITYKFYP